MSLVVNTNMTSLITQNYLTTNQNSLSQATEHLASGLRINSAADDAAGYAISQRMTAQVNGDNTAIQNANNAVSLAQTAQGDLTQITNNLQTVNELAVEAANATNSSSDRQSLNNEAQQLLQEIDRVASTSQFNGVSLLNGTFQSAQFQVGGQAGDTITIGSISSARIASLGQGYAASTSGTATGTGVTAAGQLVIDGTDVYQGTAIQGDAQSLANAINNAGIAGVTATAAPTTVTGGTAATGGGGAATTLTINGVTTAAFNASGSGATAEANAISAINSISAATGVSAADNGSGEITLTAVDGRNITVAATGSTAANLGVTSTATTYSTVTLNSTNSTALTATGAEATALGFTASTSASLSGTSLANINLSTVSGATTALASLANALNQINASNASLGAYQNRFQSAVSSLQSESQNLTAARSTIEDANFAQETAAETSASVLEQAGIAVLGQANSQPQQILSLLQHL